MLNKETRILISLEYAKDQTTLENVKIISCPGIVSSELILTTFSSYSFPFIAPPHLLSESYNNHLELHLFMLHADFF